MDSPLQPVTRRIVGSREAYLCDNLFDDATITRVAALLKALQYRRVETSRTGTDVSGASAEVPEYLSSSEPLFAQMKAFAEKTFAVSGLRKQRLYVNSTVYGDMYYPHRDYGEGDRHISVLYYANPQWSVDWGGETILYSDDGDAQLAVTPRPGRILAFHGAILHRGGVPTRLCYEERLTVAYKLRLPEAVARGEETGTNAAAPLSLAEAVAAVAAAQAADDSASAARLGEESLSAGLVHPIFFRACAIEAERAGLDEEALAFYMQGRALTPRDLQFLDAIGLCLIRLGRFQEAIYAFEESLRIAPAQAQTHHQLGIALAKAARWDLAERAHARAAQLDPRLTEAIAAVAAMAARRGDERVARSHAARALKLDPTNATAQGALAVFDTRG
ncbi:MAG TPA: 2OG-Fe(II) oxygenase [Rhizomicrobium sp.]|jgi:Flp pilus assembly protein TadD